MVNWQDITIKYRTHTVIEALSLNLSDGQSLGICGPNSSGKTSLALAIAGKIPVYRKDGPMATEKNIAFVPFHASLKMMHSHAPYRQQRWNNIDREVVPTVAAYLGPLVKEALPLLKEFRLGQHLNHYLISL